MSVMKEQTKRIFNFLKNHANEDLTAQDVADALGFEDKRSVDGSFTSFQKKGYGVREEGEIELADGSHKRVKYLRLTEAGMAYDPDNPEQ